MKSDLYFGDTKSLLARYCYISFKILILVLLTFFSLTTGQWYILKEKELEHVRTIVDYILQLTAESNEEAEI